MCVIESNSSRAYNILYAKWRKHHVVCDIVSMEIAFDIDSIFRTAGCIENKIRTNYQYSLIIISEINSLFSNCML